MGMDTLYMYASGGSSMRLFDCHLPDERFLQAHWMHINSRVRFVRPVRDMAEEILKVMGAKKRSMIVLHYRTKEFDSYDAHDTPERLGQVMKRISDCAGLVDTTLLYVATDQKRMWFGSSFPNSRVLKA